MDLWLKNSIGSKLDYDILIIDYLESLDKEVAIPELLRHAKALCHQQFEGHPEDIVSQLSYKAFNAAIDYLLQFWHFQAN